MPILRPSSRAAVPFIFVTVLLDVIGFGLLIPVSPRLVMSLLGTTDEAAAAPYYGWLAATYAVMQFVCTPVLGALSDRFGRRPVLLVSILGSGLDYFAGALAPTLAWLFVTRAINGVSGASLSVANAYIADVTPPEKRAGAFGMIGAAFGLGFILGPLMGGVLGQIDLRLPFYAAGGLAVLNWAYGLMVLPESLPPEKRARPGKQGLSWRTLNPLAVALGVRKYPGVVKLAVSYFFLNCGMFTLHATWVLYTSRRYGWDELATGLSLGVVGVGAAVVQGGLARRIIPAIGEKRALLAGITIGVLAYIGYGLAMQGWMIYAIIVAASLGGIAGPAGQSLITRSVNPTEQGAVQGSLTALNGLASIVAFVVGPQVFAAFAPAVSSPGSPPAAPPAGVYVPGAVMFFSAGLALIGLLAAWRAVRGGAGVPEAYGQPVKNESM